MISKELDKLEVSDVQSLINNGVREGRTVEYKEKLPGGSDEEKREFLADVSSFANAAGGDILYGVKGHRDAAGNATGLPENLVGLSGVNSDAEQLRLEQLMRDGIDPRIVGVRLRFLDGFSRGPMMVLRVPQSFAAPHMVVFKNLSRFFSRTGAGKYQLDVREIRLAFASSESLPQRIRGFRDDRLAKIVAGQTPIELEGKKRLVLHLLPVSAFDRPTSIDLRKGKVRETATLAMVRLGGIHVKDHRRFNLDGFVIHGEEVNPDTHRNYCMGYVQAFRNGVLEVVATLDLPGILGNSLPEHFGAKLTDYFEHYLDVIKSMDISPPLFVMLNLLNVKGTSLYLPSIPVMLRASGSNQPFDRDHLLLPEVLVEDFGAPPADLLLPILDALFQAGGLPNYFDDRR